MTEAIGYVALGSNVGDRRASLELAQAAMAEPGLELTRRSSVWETEPVGTSEPGWFLNMVVQIRSSRAPSDILDLLLAIEQQAGRIRGASRNGPRVLDLDLLVLGDARIDEPRLTLPHPRMWERRFVLAPLAEIEPDLRNPETGKTVEQCLGELDDRHQVRRLSTVAAFAAGRL